MRKIIIAKISSAVFICMTLDSKLSQVVKYNNDDKYWKWCDDLPKIRFPCLRVIRLADSNPAVMEKLYY